MEQTAIEAIVQILKSLGVPGAWLLVIGFTARKFTLWFMDIFQTWVVPQAESCIKAYHDRQEAMAECQKKLTESTILIQQENRDKLQAIEDLLPTLCSAKCPIQSGRKG